MNGRSVILGSGVSFGESARVEVHHRDESSRVPVLTIGANSSFGDYLHIGCANEIQIGENLLAGSSVLIIDHTHGNPKEGTAERIGSDPKQRDLFSKAGIFIGKNVWLCDNVTVLAGSNIGDGAVVSAGVLVRGAVEPGVIFRGKS
jgi:acetyltransferase-like isoleucine patch superfamily enzyme